MARIFHPAQPPAPKIELSIVIFDVVFDPYNSGFTEEEAMMQIFAFTPPLRFRGKWKTKAQYMSGNYDQLPSGVWVGQFEMQRTSKASRVVSDKRRGNLFVDADDETVTTSEHRTSYAYNPKAGKIVYRERSAVPYTRLVTFVSAASIGYGGQNFGVELIPQKSPFGIAHAIKNLTKVTSVSVKYRHSQSPGSAFIDHIVEALNAEEAQEVVKAKEGDSLNKTALTDGTTPISHAIEHIQKNDDNGKVVVHGYSGSEHVSINSRNPVERRRIESPDTPRGIDLALANVALRFPQKD